MESEDLYKQAQQGSNIARKKLLKKYPKTFKVLQEQEEKKKTAEEIRIQQKKEKESEEAEERKRIEDEERRKQAKINAQNKSKRQRKIAKIEQILSSAKEEENEVGYLKEYIVRKIETPIYGPTKRGPSAWGIIEYADRIGTDVSYEEVAVIKCKMTKREALIKSIVEEEKKLFFEKSEDKLYQAQVDDVLGLPYEGKGVFIIELDGIKYQIPCDNRILKTFTEEGIKGVEYRKRGKINFDSIRQAIQRRFYKGER